MQRLRAGKSERVRRGHVQGNWVTGFVAALFIGTGIALGNISERYGEQKEEDAKAAALAAIQGEHALAETRAEETKVKKETKTAEKEPETQMEEETQSSLPPYEPAPDKLNLAYFYPEDAESEEIIDSYAGEVFQELMVLDLDWLSDLYGLSDVSPSAMASRLGKGKKAVMGGYNPRDKAHKANNPSSWVIHDWKKIHVNFIDGDGRAVDGFSNVKDILSMASVYTYFTDRMDVDTFAEYSRQLWKNSHSHSLSMGDLYYCSGCLNKTEEELVREAEKEEFEAEQMSFFPTTSPVTSIREEGVSGVVQSRSQNSATSGEISSGETSTSETSLGETSTSETIAGDTSAGSSLAADSPNSGTTAGGSLTGSLVFGNSASGTAAEAAESSSAASLISGSSASGAVAGDTSVDSSLDSEHLVSGTIAEGASAGSLVSGNSASGTVKEYVSFDNSSASGMMTKRMPADTEANKSTDASPSDLQNFPENQVNQAQVNQVQVNQASGQSAVSPGGREAASASEKTEKKTQVKKTQYDCPGHVDLYIRVKVLGLEEKKGLFSISKAAEKKKWDGWNQENISSVKKISSQDWFEDYGLSISSISLSVPLTNQEIEGYMNRLPADTSVTRRNVIHFALSSVGRVPYYWGGKPSSPGYEGNNFGALIPADGKGRLLRGLDCSGWINWVYWSATGRQLAGESTSSLSLCGKQVSRSDLKPGDIIVRTGANAHVVMFLGWNADGTMNVIHETSGSINNVSVAAISPPSWPYYRKLVD